LPRGRLQLNLRSSQRNLLTSLDKLVIRRSR
jgi:hypothetical protein